MKARLGIAATILLAPGAMAQNVALTAAHLEAASMVQVGSLPCELGQTVVLSADQANIGFFSLQLGKLRYRLSPELTTTGAIRLEDKAAGIVWLQLANKSMLMKEAGQAHRRRVQKRDPDTGIGGDAQEPASQRARCRSADGSRQEITGVPGRGRRNESNKSTRS